MDLRQIKRYAEDRNIPFKRLAEKIGMSEANLHRCVRENKIQAQDLEKISGILHVSITKFFDNTSVIEGREFKEVKGDYYEQGHNESRHYGPEYHNSCVEQKTNLEMENDTLRKDLIKAQQRIIDLMDENNKLKHS